MSRAYESSGEPVCRRFDRAMRFRGALPGQFFLDRSRAPRARLQRRVLVIDESLKSLAIDDGHSFALNADPAFTRELVERFRHGLAGATEPICDGLVRPALSHRGPCSPLALLLGEQKVCDA